MQGVFQGMLLGTTPGRSEGSRTAQNRMVNCHAVAVNAFANL